MEFDSAEHERVYRVMRSNVGDGGSARDESGPEGLWRWVRARYIARAASKSRLAVEQAFPDRATEALPYYERLLRITPSGDATVEQRQAAAVNRFTLSFASDMPDLTRALQRIDPRFNVIMPAAELSVTTQPARAFDGYAAELPMGDGRRSTAWPNYSSDFEVYVVLELGDGVAPGVEERDEISAARRLLDDVLPAHNTAHVATHRGFKLDRSKLDLTSFGG